MRLPPAGALALAPALSPPVARSLARAEWPPAEGPGTPGGGGYAGLVHNVACTKAMLQAALSA